MDLQTAQVPVVDLGDLGLRLNLGMEGQALDSQPYPGPEHTPCERDETGEDGGRDSVAEPSEQRVGKDNDAYGSDGEEEDEEELLDRCLTSVLQGPLFRE